jgi:hypothetical protein
MYVYTCEGNFAIIALQVHMPTKLRYQIRQPQEQMQQMPTKMGLDYHKMGLETTKWDWKLKVGLELQIRTGTMTPLL